MRISLIFLVLVATIQVYCNTGTMPLAPTDPRELRWSIDSLSFPRPTTIQTLMSRLWASSSDNVFAIGHCDHNPGRLYRYNGEAWYYETLVPILNAPYDLYGIYGFSSSDIYIVGTWDDPIPPYEENSLIIHYNGSTWDKINIPLKKMLTSIWGFAPDDIWAGGNFGTFVHFDGMHWAIDSIAHSGYPGAEISLNIDNIAGESTNLLRASSYSVVPNRGTIYHSLLYTNGQWAVQDSSWEYYDDVTGYWVSPAGTWYVGTSAGLFKMQGSKLIPVLDQEMWVWGLHGTSDNNVYITAKRYDTFYVMHYNGSDWHTYDALTRTEDQQVIADVFAIDGEVFVTGYTNGAWPQKSIIFHGK